MRQYVVPDYPLTADIPDADPLLSESWARDFIENFIGCEIEELHFELLLRFLAVFRYRGRDADGAPTGGWIVTGNTPLLALNDDEITTPLEALAIYSYYLIPWCFAKGVVDDRGVLPDYRVPPDWEQLSYWDGFEDSRIGATTSYIEWKLIGENEGEIIHPDIREYCYERAWLSRPECSSN